MKGFVWVPKALLNFQQIVGVEKWPGGVLPYMGYIGMCHCKGYGFQAFHSRIGYINQETDQLVEDFI